MDIHEYLLCLLAIFLGRERREEGKEGQNMNEYEYLF